jgi:hypothetical protein
LKLKIEQRASRKNISYCHIIKTINFREADTFKQYTANTHKILLADCNQIFWPAMSTSQIHQADCTLVYPKKKTLAVEE